MKLLPALVISNTLQWSFGRLNRIERRRAREIKEYQPGSPLGDESSPTHEEDSGRDVGVLYANAKAYEEDDTLLFDESRTLRAQCKEFVHCDKGYEVGTGKTCEEACGGECCFNPDADDGYSCQFFTGSVCKDGISCIGEAACYEANITSVIRSCKGYEACYLANDYKGYIGSIIDSCHGNDACRAAAGYNGFIDEISEACIGPKSCYRAAREYGSITKITKACIGENACFSVARLGGTIAEITKACIGQRACEGAAFRDGSIGGVGINKACNGTKACYVLAGNPTAPYVAYDIPQGIRKCCNSDYECEFKTEDDLPEECSMRKKKEKKDKPWGEGSE